MRVWEGGDKLWSSARYISTGRDHNFPPNKVSHYGTERKPYKSSSGTHRGWALGSKTLYKSPQFSPTCGPPLFMGRGFPHGMRLLRVSHGLWLARYPAAAAIIAAAADALSWPQSPRSRRQRENQQLCLTLCAVGNGEQTNRLYFTTQRMLHPLVRRNLELKSIKNLRSLLYRSRTEPKL